MAGMLLCPVSGWLKAGECIRALRNAIVTTIDSRQMKIKKDKLNYRRD